MKSSFFILIFFFLTLVSKATEIQHATSWGGVSLTLLSNARAASPRQEPKKVVSFSILEDIVQKVVPSEDKIESAVPSGMDSHGHEPMAKEYLTFKKADLIILAGNNFEPWANRIIEKVHAKAPVYYVSQGITLLPLKDDEHHHESPDHKDHLNFDPHIWQSPEVMNVVIGQLSEYLQKQYPVSASDIKKKTTTYLSELKKIQEKYKLEFSKIPAEKKQMVMAHNSFQYFAKEFGVQVYSPLDASQEGDSSLTKVSMLIKKIKADHIQSLFLEKSSPESLMKNISKETGIEIKGVLYSDCLSTDSSASTYLKMLEYNFNLILKSMKGSKP